MPFYQKNELKRVNFKGYMKFPIYGHREDLYISLSISYVTGMKKAPVTPEISLGYKAHQFAGTVLRSLSLFLDGGHLIAISTTP